MRFARPLGDATKSKVVLPFVVVTLIWGSTWIVIRDQLGDVPPSWSVCYRFVAASLTMFAYALATRTPLRLGRGHAVALLMALTIFSFNFNLVYRAEAHVTSGLVAVTFALLVVYNAVIARVFLGQSISRPFLTGSAVAMLGVGLLFAHELRGTHRDAHETLLGIGLTLLAMLFASIANVVQSTKRARELPMPSLLAWAMLWGALADGVWAWATVGPPRIEASATYVAGVLYLGVIASALAFTLYFTMMRLIGPARGGYVNVLTPVIAMLISTVFEGYVWSIEAAAGGVLVMLGLVLAMRARRPG